MKDLYLYLESFGIVEGPDVKAVIEKLSPQSLVDFYNECQHLIESETKESERSRLSLFDFSASNSIVGSGVNCQGLECRLNEANNLSLFATLYSNSVTIPNFFDFHLDRGELDLSSEFLEYLKTQVVGHLVVLIYYKPLILAGVIKINPHKLQYCANCLARKLEGLNEFEEYSSDLQNYAEDLISANISLSKGKKGIVEVVDPERFLGPESVTFRVTREAGDPPVSEMSDTVIGDLARDAATSAVDDLILQHLASTIKGTTYLTQRSLDKRLLEKINRVQQPQDETVSVLAKNMTYALPFLENLEPGDILDVRERNSEAFRVYRDTLTALLRELGKAPEKRLVDEALRDEIAPQINKLNQIMSNHQKRYKSKAGKLSIGGGLVVTIGFMAQSRLGLDPTLFNTIFSGVTLASVGPKVGEYLTEASVPPSEVSDHNYYFLWKLDQKAG